MNIVEINSFEDLKNELKGINRAYLLLYRSDSESSKCAYQSLSNASKTIEDVKLLSADVKLVRDIHQKYSISSAPALLYFENEEYKSIVKGCNSEDFYVNLIKQNLYKCITKNRHGSFCQNE